MQKILNIGTSLGVTIPMSFAKVRGIKAGDRVEVKINEKTGTVLLTPVSQLSNKDEKVALIAQSLIQRYREDLLELAK